MRIARMWGLAAALAAGLVGCNGGGGGGGVGNAAIDATLGALFASLRSGTELLDPALTGGAPVDNPFEAAESKQDLAVSVAGEGDENGTVPNVNVAFTITHDPSDGSAAGTLTITETGGTHVFLTADFQFGKLGLSAHALDLGFNALDPFTGTGTAFVVVRAEQTRTITRTFANQSPAGLTLVNFGTLPQPAASGKLTLTLEVDLLIEYEIIATAGGLEAQVRSVDVIGGHLRGARQGGPAVERISHPTSLLRIAGSALEVDRHIEAAVGTDLPASRSFADGDSLAWNFEVRGGLAEGVGTLQTDVTGAVQNDLANSPLRSISFSDSLNITDDTKVGDGKVQVALVLIATTSLEALAGTSAFALQHAFDGTGAADEIDFDLGELLYLPGFAQRLTPIVVFH
ncbi:MAG: hypothetical protein KatS3mg102_2317 [Planctomycetota bacterium]|nr:MAG: hypothetical protein KatS3mg102_2317 [Planctomycetota bacterium]